MGSELLGESASHNERGVGATEKQPTLSYTEMFYQCLPHYLVMGLSADEFWNCDPRMYGVYREKDRLENERKNELLWLAGVYTLNAVQSSLSDKEEHKYPNKPFDLQLRHEEDQDGEPTDEDIQKSQEFAKVLDWMYRVNKQKQGEHNG